MRQYSSIFVVAGLLAAVAVGQTVSQRPQQVVHDIQAVEAVATEVSAMQVVERDDLRIVPIAAASPAFQWRGQDLRIAQIGQALLTLDETNRLTATISANLLTFDDLDVTIHGAVFDADGNLLAAAQTVEHVDRTWLGAPGLVMRDVQLDFGRCACYTNLASFSAAATHGIVRTPEQWLHIDDADDAAGR